MDDFPGLSLKALRHLHQALLLALAVAAVSLALTPTLGYAQEPEQYREDFDDGQARGWRLDPEWGLEAVEDGYVLTGIGHTWATYEAGRWQDSHVRFRLMLLEEGSVIHLNYHLSDEGRYFIGFGADGLYLSKEAPWGTFHEDLDSSSAFHSYKDWHTVEIIGEGPRIQVAVDGNTELDYTDAEPLLSGTIAFETLDGAVAQVDDIEVIGFPPPQEAPDLAILAADEWEIVEDGRVLVLFVEIRNEGGVEAPGTAIWVGEVERGWASALIPVPALAPLEITTVVIELGIPDEQGGTTHTFMVAVDPENEVPELDEENNVARTPGILIPPLGVPTRLTERPPAPAPTPPDGPFWNLVPPMLVIGAVVTLTVIAAVTLGGITFTIRRTIKIQRRKEWQEKAEEEEPPETCQPCTRHCQKIELELEPALRKIAHLTLSAYDPVSGEQSREGQVKGEIVDGLNRAVTSHRRGEKLEELQEQVAPLARMLLEQIMEWMHGEAAPRDVSVTGHLGGGKATCKFILRHCRRRGNVNTWEKEGEWKATVADERDEPVGTLRSLDPTEPGIPERLAPELTRLLVQFIDKV